jgi:cold shock protein
MASAGNTPRLTGTIRAIKRDLGFGFITHRESGIDHFFHRSEVQGEVSFGELEEDQRVSFVAEDGPRGPRALDVVALN